MALQPIEHMGLWAIFLQLANIPAGASRGRVAQDRSVNRATGKLSSAS